MGPAIKHPVSDRVKPPFAIFDIRALWRSPLSVRVPECQKLQMRDGLTRSGTVLHSCTHMATVGVKLRVKINLVLILAALILSACTVVLMISCTY